MNDESNVWLARVVAKHANAARPVAGGPVICTLTHCEGEAWPCTTFRLARAVQMMFRVMEEQRAAMVR